MIKRNKLTLIKTIHTIIWLFFTTVFFYMFYAVVVDRIDEYVWIGIALFSLEIIVLLIFKKTCPLTIIARRYSNSSRDNFDIFLPNWLAKNNKIIYSGFLIVFIFGLAYRLIHS